MSSLPAVGVALSAALEGVALDFLTYCEFPPLVQVRKVLFCVFYSPFLSLLSSVFVS